MEILRQEALERDMIGNSFTDRVLAKRIVELKLAEVLAAGGVESDVLPPSAPTLRRIRLVVTPETVCCWR